jgi:hypothetical protein
MCSLLILEDIFKKHLMIQHILLYNFVSSLQSGFAGVSCGHKVGSLLNYKSEDKASIEHSSKSDQ